MCCSFVSMLDKTKVFWFWMFLAEFNFNEQNLNPKSSLNLSVAINLTKNLEFEKSVKRSQNLQLNQIKRKQKVLEIIP